MQFPDRPRHPLRIAFYAPMKPPGHPVPSGDRLMARQLLAALAAGGHEVAVISDLRSYSAAPDPEAYRVIADRAAHEAARISDLWARDGCPDLWFAYHPYYKAPDLIGPGLARRHGLAYVTAESSWSARRNIGVWAGMQARVLEGIGQAAVNICLTGRDRDGILAALPGARAAMLRPFIDAAPFLRASPAGADPARLITVAMMRPGDKMDSYRMLTAALALLPAGLDWRLSVVGDGPERDEVRALFAGLGDGRITWHGQQPAENVAGLMAASAIYVWPGQGEAYGLAYLEAQAAGLPVVAMRTAGVPEAVRDGETALLSPDGDAAALADNIAQLLVNRERRRAMATAARRFVLTERTLDTAGVTLNRILDTALERAP